MQHAEQHAELNVALRLVLHKDILHISVSTIFSNIASIGTAM